MTGGGRRRNDGGEWEVAGGQRRCSGLFFFGVLGVIRGPPYLVGALGGVQICSGLFGFVQGCSGCAGVGRRLTMARFGQRWQGGFLPAQE